MCNKYNIIVVIMLIHKALVFITGLEKYNLSLLYWHAM